MFVWALMFLCVAAVSALFGFGGFAPVVAGAAQLLCFVFLGLAGAALGARVLERSRSAYRSD